jgi:hypothetical protein
MVETRSMKNIKYKYKYDLEDDQNNDDPAAARPLRPRKLKAHIRPNARNEKHDVFRRINMHGGDANVCWEWRGAHNLGTRGERRPRVTIASEDYYTYRVVYELYYGRELGDMEVIRHSCDHCWCCNPHHLTVGTQHDNVQDMLMRERVGMKMIHVKKIMQMLEIGTTSIYISERMRHEHGMYIDPSVIRRIRLRQLYKHIPWEWGDNYVEELYARRKQRASST